MPRFLLGSMVLSIVIHLIRFGYSEHLWFFLVTTGLLTFLLVHGDDFGFFDRTTGWFHGRYVDEPTPPIFLKGIVFVMIMSLCVGFSLKRNFPECRRCAWNAAK